MNAVSGCRAAAHIAAVRNEAVILDLHGGYPVGDY